MPQTEPGLQALFSPMSVAVVGASTRKESVGHAVFSNILLNGYTGVVYPVNPKARSVLAVKAYKSVLDIKDDVDLAVVIVPSKHVPGVMEDCGRKGVKAAVIISAGFKEMGEEGAKRQREVAEIVQRYGIPVVGPNCLGIINTDEKVSFNASFGRSMPGAGNIALVSQSGAVGVAALEYADAHGIGLSKFASVGNKADRNENDLLEYLRDDPATDVILLYVEDLADPKRFVELAREITGDLSKPKPIIAIKSGRTEAGAQAASSHTGALAGSDTAYESLFHQCGVVRVDSLEDIFEKAVAFSSQPLPKGDRVAIVTNAGGPGIMATDACVRNGLRLAQFTDKTKEALRKGLPAAAAINNPVDVIGDADEERYRVAIEAALSDENVDAILIISTPQLMTNIASVARTISGIVTRHSKTALVCLMTMSKEKEAMDVLASAGLHNYTFPEDAARALASMAKFADWVDRPRTKVRTFDVDRPAADRVIARARKQGRTFLPEPEAYEILRAYGFPLLPARFESSAAAATKAAEEIGYPVAMKIVSPDIIHKVDVGGVALNLASGEAVGRAYDAMMESVKGKKVQGVVIQKMAPKGREIILGTKRDPHFGPLLLFGLGGTYVEIFKDVSFRVAPITELGARNMIEEIKASRILTGYRGQPPGDVAAIVECLQRLSQMALDLDDLAELDMNPLMVFEEGKGAAVLDARVFLTSSSAPCSGSS